MNLDNNVTNLVSVATGTSVAFIAQIVRGSQTVTWTWSSDLDGNFGTTPSTSARLSPGRHVVRVRAVDAQRNIAEDKIIVNVGMLFAP